NPDQNQSHQHTYGAIRIAEQMFPVGFHGHGMILLSLFNKYHGKYKVHQTSTGGEYDSDTQFFELLWFNKIINSLSYYNQTSRKNQDSFESRGDEFHFAMTV